MTSIELRIHPMIHNHDVVFSRGIIMVSWVLIRLLAPVTIIPLCGCHYGPSMQLMM